MCREKQEKKHGEKNSLLQQVILDLGGEWAAEAAVLKEELEQAGIGCIQYERWRNPDLEHGNRQTENCLLITDNREMARKAGKVGMICVGVDRAQKGFFEGAVLVADCLAVLEADTLEELYLHEKGLPVTVAQTERLILREMAEADFADLCRISSQEGMEHLMLPGMRAEDFFNEASLQAYAKMAYRFYGYGLWSVVLQDGTVIGCCGLQDLDEEQLQNLFGEQEQMREQAENKKEFPMYLLELQYMIDEKYRRKGYAEEMCRAAIRYASVRTDADALCVRCHRDNRAAIALAEKLGFFDKQSCAKEVKILLRKMT